MVKVPRHNRRADSTREQLLTAATVIFARDGFDATSLRMIAQQAKVNQALIGYHFGSKQGLYLAVFSRLVEGLQQRFFPWLSVIHDELPHAQRDKARQLLLELVSKMANFMVNEALATWAQLILREQQSPTSAFDLFYEGVMQPMLTTAIALMVRIKPQLSEERCRLLVLTVFGQLLIFRSSRAAVLKLMDWQTIDEPQYQQIVTLVVSNVCAILDNE